MLATEMRNKVASGEWNSGAQIPPERELELSFSASRPTVSKALSQLVNEGLLLRRQGSGTFVRKDLPRKSNLIQFMHYKGQKELATLTDHLSLLQAIESRIAAKGFRILFASSPDSNRLHQSLDTSIGGLIAVGPVSNDVIKQYQTANIPVILVDHEASDVDSVNLDNRSAAYQCVKTLIESGHRRICFVCDMQDTARQWPNSALRQAGHEAALRDAGTALPEDLIIPNLEGVALAGRIEELRPSAVLFSSSLSCQRFLAERSQTTSESAVLTVASFGSKDAFTMPSALKQIVLEIDWIKMGEIVADLLLERIDDNTIPTRRILLNPLVKRIS